MATPVSKILIVRGTEGRMIRPAYLRTWQRQGWDVAPEGWEPPADPDAEEVQIVPSQEELEGQLALVEDAKTEEEVPSDSDKNESETDETSETDLSEDDETSDQAAPEEN